MAYLAPPFYNKIITKFLYIVNGYRKKNEKERREYLDTAAKLYRYLFADNPLIHVQHPQAAACAELETWNEKMGRWVNRGAKGIAMIDDTGSRQRLRYVFDIEDTHMVRGRKDTIFMEKEERYEGNFLEEMDVESIRVSFRNLITFLFISWEKVWKRKCCPII